MWVVKLVGAGGPSIGTVYPDLLKKPDIGTTYPGMSLSTGAAYPVTTNHRHVHEAIARVSKESPVSH